MLFDNQGNVVPPGPTEMPQESFDIRTVATRDARGNLRVANTSPPALSGEPKEVYSGPGSSTEMKPNNAWEPVGAGDTYNLRSLRVSTGMLGFK